EAGLRWVMSLLDEVDQKWLLQRFHEIQYFLGVPRNFDATPLTHEPAAIVKDEGAALYAAHLAAVHVFHSYDVEQPARFFVRVRQQVEREIRLGFEILVGFQAVARDAENGASEALKLRIQIAEMLSFRRAAGGVVLGVEIDNVRMAALLCRLES